MLLWLYGWLSMLLQKLYAYTMGPSFIMIWWQLQDLEAYVTYIKNMHVRMAGNTERQTCQGQKKRKRFGTDNMPEFEGLQGRSELFLLFLGSVSKNARVGVMLYVLSGYPNQTIFLGPTRFAPPNLILRLGSLILWMWKKSMLCSGLWPVNLTSYM